MYRFPVSMRMARLPGDGIPCRGIVAVRILGMPLLHGLITGVGAAARAVARGNPPFDQISHYFVDMGGDSTLAIFEFPKGKAPKADRNSVAGMQHISFASTPARFVEMQERLKRNGVDIMFGPKVVLPPNIQSIYFFDPNGIRLEISADMSGDETDLKVVASVLMDRESHLASPSTARARNRYQSICASWAAPGHAATGYRAPVLVSSLMRGNRRSRLAMSRSPTGNGHQTAGKASVTGVTSITTSLSTTPTRLSS